MGASSDRKKFLLKKGMIMIAGLCSVLGIIFNSVAIGTDFWIVSTGVNQNGSIPDIPASNSLTVNYGLFHGKKLTKGLLGDSVYSLTVFCPTGEGVCLVSCGVTDDQLKREFAYLRFGQEEYLCQVQSTKTRVRSSITKAEDNLDSRVITTPTIRNGTEETKDNTSEFMDYGLWITTLIFLSLMLAFQIISAGLCAFNTTTVPVESIVGPMGIYLANTVAGLAGLITLSLWGDLYSSNLKKELAIQETILDTYRMTSTNLGFSYWFVFVSLLLAIVSCICVRFRNSLKKFSNNEGVGVESSSPGGMIMLY